MDKRQLTWAEFSTLEVAVCVCAMQLSCFETKLPNLMLKTRPKQLLGSLPLDIALPAQLHETAVVNKLINDSIQQ
jgi:hypothetical protein